MEFEVRQWELRVVYNNLKRIDFPEYQRAVIWSEKKMSTLIDSILKGIDIPKIYLHKTENGTENGWDCVDGQQRLVSIKLFRDGLLKDLEGRYWADLSKEEKKDFEKSELTIVEIEEDGLSEDDVRLLFRRLQLGKPLNVGEILNAIKSNMREFVDELAEHPFIKNIGITNWRFAKNQVCAQICNNSLYFRETEEFGNSKLKELESFYRIHHALNLDSKKTNNIRIVFDKLHELFGADAKELRNRASVVTLYLLVENMMFSGELTGKEEQLRDFYLKFNRELRKEVRAGFDATNRFLINYQNYVIQSADSKKAITARHSSIRKAFDYYLKTDEIIHQT